MSAQQPRRAGHRLGTAVDAQLAVQVDEVGLDRALLHEQLGRPHLNELAAGAQPRQGQRGGPRGWRSPDAAPVAGGRAGRRSRPARPGHARGGSRPGPAGPGGGQGSPVVDQAGDRSEKDRVASSASQANQPGLLTGCGSLALPVRHRGNLRHPLPRPDPAPDIPNAPNTTLMVDGQAQSVGTRHTPEIGLFCCIRGSVRPGRVAVGTARRGRAWPGR